MPRRTRIAAVLAATLLAALLTGCDQVLPEPMAYTRVGDAIVVRACLAMTIGARTIEEETSTTTTGPDGRTAVDVKTTVVWWDDRDLEVVPGDEFRLGDSSRPRSVIDDWSVVPDEPIPFPLTGESYLVSMPVRAADGHGTWTAIASLNPAEIVEGEWVDSNGYPMDPPCVHDRCLPGAGCWNNWPVPTGEATRSDPTSSPTPHPAPVG